MVRGFETRRRRLRRAEGADSASIHSFDLSERRRGDVAAMALGVATRFPRDVSTQIICTAVVNQTLSMDAIIEEITEDLFADEVQSMSMTSMSLL